MDGNGGFLKFWNQEIEVCFLWHAERAKTKKNKKNKKNKKKRHRYLAVKFGTSPKNFSLPKLQLLVL